MSQIMNLGLCDPNSMSIFEPSALQTWRQVFLGKSNISIVSRINRVLTFNEEALSEQIQSIYE